MTTVKASAPRLRPYLAALLLLALTWMIFILIGSYQYWKSTGTEISGMRDAIRGGLFVIVGLTAVVFAGHWAWRHIASVSGVSVTGGVASPVVAASAHAANPGALAGTGPQYVLEVRGLGMAISGDHQDTPWKRIVEKADNFASALSQNPKDYGETPDIRMTFSKVDTGAAFEYAAAEAIDHWPLPVIIINPPTGKDVKSRAAYRIADGRQKAGLGVTLFLWEYDANTSSAMPALDRLFQFFDEHPDVPAALIVTQDGMIFRSLLDTPGTPKEPLGAYIPPIPNSMVSLLVTRSDRVDQLMRPFVVSDVPADIDNDKTQFDIVKLWNFYWQEDERFQEEADKTAGAVYGGTTMKTEWWTAKLPELWKQIGNKGPGDFKPSPYLPVRWTSWQLEEFDEAPQLGYLHRPVHIKLTDGEGHLLKRTEQIKALQDGWQHAIATLPKGTKPARVFYDTTLDREWIIPLTQALHGNAEGIELDNVKEGYDIGRRLGNTGVSSALVQIGLATVAGYQDGGASATVHLTEHRDAAIVMVSPPDETAKAANAKHRGANPFRTRVPGG
ncbi:hypothetical protein B7R77_17275 [Ralstonia solanacearum K60]|uniref:DUF2875 domain-containing protein n=1 Tax=Ralstonia solanacearum K60 TaxID=1091042 RepID=A0AAP8D6A5_RALSL|nr:DUF2875 family protein [Ralstonia solanacearum]OYQ14825.1 hypothetical protein B7R77_17275 [Ralstonia solanacearum K60]CCF95853.1 conserved hypothetical protein [Ralstonia solanacearum K60]